MNRVDESVDRHTIDRATHASRAINVFLHETSEIGDAQSVGDALCAVAVGVVESASDNCNEQELVFRNYSGACDRITRETSADEPNIAFFTGAGLCGIKHRICGGGQRVYPLPQLLGPVGIGFPFDLGRSNWQNDLGAGIQVMATIANERRILTFNEVIMEVCDSRASQSRLVPESPGVDRRGTRVASVRQKNGCLST